MALIFLIQEILEAVLRLMVSTRLINGRLKGLDGLYFSPYLFDYSLVLDEQLLVNFLCDFFLTIFSLQSSYYPGNVT